MLKLRVFSIHPDEVENLRNWFSELETTRRAEALATLADETVTHETAILISDPARPLLVYAMEVADPNQAAESANSGKHPIDAEHHAVLQAALSGSPDQEVVFDLSR